MIKDGIININKPQNMTSHDVVAIMRRTLGIKKIGHTGTLDPMATGVLPICVGKATRIIEYLDLDMKTYRCKLLLGTLTDTQDIWGEVLETRPLETKSGEAITASMIETAFQGFDGVIDQKPPMYSALKVNGKRLYEYARAGETVDVKTRQIFIKDLNIEEICLENKAVTFTVTCSKGTYIRTICQDIGEALGCGACMESLTRLASGAFTIEKAFTIEEVQKLVASAAGGNACGSGFVGEDASSAVDVLSAMDVFLPIEYPLCHFGEVIVDKVNGLRFINGWHIGLDECRVVYEPEYKDTDFYLPIREEYRHAYKVFMKDEGKDREFLGVAFYNFQYKKLVADKVIYTGRDFFTGDKGENI